MLRIMSLRNNFLWKKYLVPFTTKIVQWDDMKLWKSILEQSYMDPWMKQNGLLISAFLYSSVSKLKLRAFEFIVSSICTIVRWKDLLKFLSICFFQQKRLYKPLHRHLRWLSWVRGNFFQCHRKTLCLKSRHSKRVISGHK